MAVRFILNEKEYAEYCLENGIPDKNPYQVISIIAKYYYNLRYNKTDIINKLFEFLDLHYPRYKVNEEVWFNSISKMILKLENTTLYEISGVKITKSEMGQIQKIKNVALEKLMFTMLCIAKLHNIKHDQNNNWLNANIREVFRLARVSGNVIDQYRKIGKLKGLGLIEFPKKNGNLNCKITFIDNTDEEVLFVSDFRELGYTYLNYCGKNFVKCNKCGKLITQNKSKTKKYCNDCRSYTPKKIKLISCIDCGKIFEIKSLNNKTFRCEICQQKNERLLRKNRNKKYYKNRKKRN